MKDVYEMLNLPNKIEQQILQYRYEIDGLRGRLLPGSMNYDKEKVQNTFSDKVPETIGRIDEIEREINELKKKKEKAINNIKKATEKLPENQRIVILGVYVAGRPIKQIAKDMKYSIQRVYQYRTNAIEMLYKLM